MKQKAAGYVRVSTNSQASDDKMSLQNQMNKIMQYCQYEVFELREPLFEDAGFSGTTDERQGLQDLLAAARMKEFEHVVVNDLTRFGRNTRDLLNNVELLKDLGITFHTVKEKIDCRTEYGMFLLRVLSACAELEAEQIRIRMGEVKLAKLRQHKIHLGKLAYGYTWNDVTQQIEINEKEAAIYKRLIASYLSGTSLTDLALQLQKEQVPSRFDKKWFTSTLSNTFRNTIHKGYTVVKLREKRKGENGEADRVVVEEVQFECEPLISVEDWDKLQVRLSKGRSRRSGRPLTGADNFVLRDLLVCGVCGARILPRYNHGRLLVYTCYWSVQTNKKLEAHGKTKCILPPIPAKNFDEYVYSYLLFIFSNDLSEDGDGESPWYKELVSKQRYQERLEDFDNELQTLREQLARKERGLAATRKLKEEPNFNDFEHYNLEVSTYNTQIKELKLRIAELTKAKADLDKLRAEQELFEEIAKSDQIHEIHARLLELPNEDRHRLLTGMLDGDIVVKPPSPGAKLDKDTHFGFKDWVKFAFKPNVEILNDILGIEYSSSGGDHVGRVRQVFSHFRTQVSPMSS